MLNYAPGTMQSKATGARDAAFERPADGAAARLGTYLTVCEIKMARRGGLPEETRETERHLRGKRPVP